MLLSMYSNSVILSAACLEPLKGVLRWQANVVSTGTLKCDPTPLTEIN